MKMLAVSKSGDSGGLLYRLIRQGEDARWWITDPARRLQLAGLVPQFPALAPALAWHPDLIVFDMVGHGLLADTLAKSGRRVVGGSTLMDRMELDRDYGLSLLDRAGIRTPTHRKFASIQEAEVFAKTATTRYVIKPHGNQPPELTYVPDSPENMRRYLRYLNQRHLLGRSVGVTLQEVVEGVEVSTEVWYSRGRPVNPPNITLETKSYLAGNLGMLTGAMSSAVYQIDPEAPLIRQLHRPLQPWLLAQGYTGPLDINSIVDDHGRAWPLEFSARMGYDAIYALMELLESFLGDVLRSLQAGTLSRFPIRHGWGVAVRITVPPHPMVSEDKHPDAFRTLQGLPIGGLQVPDRFWPLDVQSVNGEWSVAGVDGVIGEMTGWGETIPEASAVALRLAEALELPNKGYRIDAGSAVEPEFRRLVSLGVLGRR